MKKLIIVLAVVFALAPFTAFGLEIMSNETMKATTGQAGVSITVDNVVLWQYCESTSYIDNDGYVNILDPTDEDASTAFVIRDLQPDVGTTTLVRAIVDDTSTGMGAAEGYLFRAYDDSVVIGGVNGGADEVLGLSPANGRFASALSIDIGTCLIANAGAEFNQMPGSYAGVVIQLPTIEIRKSGSLKSYSVEQEGTAVNSGEELIRIQKGITVTAILGGTVEIVAH